jgi:hypothetical protein
MAHPLRVEYSGESRRHTRACGYTLKETAAHLGVPYSTIRRRLHCHEARCDKRS